MILDPKSPVPLYSQLADALIKQIQEGSLKPGTKIPSEHELAGRYEVGRPTVRQATDLLVRRRLLERRKGSGTFVLDQSQEVNLFSLAGTVSAFQEKGIKIQRKITRKIMRQQGVENRDNPFSISGNLYFQRVSLHKKKPFLLENIYLHPELFQGIEDYDFSTQSLSRVIQEEYNRKLGHGKQSFSIIEAKEVEAELLKLKVGTPLLLVKRQLFFHQQEPGLYAQMYCTSKPFAFTQIIGGNL